MTRSFRNAGVNSRDREYLKAVPIQQIVPDPNQPRTHFDEDDIASLSGSLSDAGFVTPLLVRRHETDPDKYMIIGGGRRWLGAMQAGIPTLPCLLVTGELTDAEVLQAQLEDNMHRKDLDPVDQANSYHRLMTLRGWTPAQLAQQLHLSARYVNNTLSLRQLSDEVQEMLVAGSITVGIAYELASRVADPEMQSQLARMAVEQRLTQDQFAAVVKRKTGKPRRARPGPTRRAFPVGRGTRVNLISNKNLTPQDQAVALYGALQEVLADVDDSPRRGRERINVSTLLEILTALNEVQPASLATAAAGTVQRGGLFLLREIFALSTYKGDSDNRVNIEVQSAFVNFLNDLSNEARLAFLPFRPHGRRKPEES